MATILKGTVYVDPTGNAADGKNDAGLAGPPEGSDEASRD